MSTTAAPDTQRTDPFWEWVQQPLIRVASRREHGQWYAIAEDYGIASTGTTEAEAYRDLARMVEAYLRSCYRDGMEFWATMRRLSKWTKLKLLVRSILARALRGRAPEPLGEEGRFLLPDTLDGTPKLT
jgi:predicted YcjX-like family ATPase